MESIDIYRSAALLIKQHGEDAVIEAAMKADAMLEKGDLDGQRVWKAIVKAIVAFFMIAISSADRSGSSYALRV